MKVEKNQNPLIFPATYWNLSQTSGNLKTFFSKFGEFLLFLPWKILGQNHIFEVKIWQNCTQKKTIECEPDK
jgi:hypothetical protein